MRSENLKNDKWAEVVGAAPAGRQIEICCHVRPACLVYVGKAVALRADALLGMEVQAGQRQSFVVGPDERVLVRMLDAPMDNGRITVWEPFRLPPPAHADPCGDAAELKIEQSGPADE